MNLTTKITTVSLMIVCFAVSLLIFLTYYKYESTLNNLIRSRFLVVSDDLENTIVSGLSLGLNLNELQTTQEVIEQIKKNDPQILSINVFERIDENNVKTVYNTRLAGIGATVPQTWTKAMMIHKPDQPWYLKEDNADIVGSNIINNLGTMTGGIVVRYSQDYLKEKSRTMLNNLVVSTSLIITVFAVLIFIGSHILFRPISHSFLKMVNLVRYFLDHQYELPDIDHANSFEEQLLESLKKFKQIQADLKVIEEKVK